jgi:hypothetical protein
MRHAPSPPVKSPPWAALALGLAFIFSFWVRSPNLGRSLADPYETSSAMSLIALENWSAAGAVRHHFAPLLTYPGEANRFVLDATMRVMSAAGEGYYTSAPPFSLILPHLLHRLFGIEPSRRSLQLMNSSLHLLAALFIFLALRLALRGRRYCDLCAGLGSALFVLLAPHLGYFCDVYDWHIFWEYFWIISLFFALVLVEQGESGLFSWKSTLLFGASNFLAVYSDYQGLLFPLAAAMFFWIRRKKYPRWRTLLFASVSSSALALILALEQYSQIAGWSALFGAAASKAQERSLTFQWTFLPWIWEHYQALYGSCLVLAGGVVLSLLVLTPRRAPATPRALPEIGTAEFALLVFSTIPVAVQHLLLLDYTANHRSAILRSGVFICCGIALLFQRLLAAPRQDLAARAFKGACLAAYLLTIVYNIELYRGPYSHSPDPLEYERIARVVRSEAASDEVVFAVSKVMLWMGVTYESKRNIQRVAGLNAARAWLRRYNRGKGIVLFINEGGEVADFKRIAL